jgi:methionyl-tRNA formyltransferase
MKVVYFGTPQFAAEVLQYLLDNGVDVVAVITKPDKALGRSQELQPTPVKTVALAHNPPVPLYQPPIVSDPTFAPILAQYDADLFVVVAFGEIIKQHLLDMPKVGCINLHASLLPKYRGAGPIQRCLINGEKETGLTVMHMVKKMDAGDAISTVVVPLDDEINYRELEEKLCKKGCKLLLDVIHDFAEGIPSRIPQEPSGVTMAPKIELEECEIDWKRPAKTIHNLVRGVSPSPGAWCYVNAKGQKKRLRVLRTRVATLTPGTAPGTAPGTIAQWDSHGIIVACGDGALELLEVQLEGKKAMPASEFARGVKITMNSEL